MKNVTISLTTRQDVYRKIDIFLGESPQEKWDLSIVKNDGKRRLTTNGQIHLWFGQIAKHRDDQTPLDVKNFCKDAFGLPLILNSVKHGDKMEFLPESKVLMEQMIYYFNDAGIPIKFKDKDE